jgi:sugar phosphate isomerase/epimerase
MIRTFSSLRRHLLVSVTSLTLLAGFALAQNGPAQGSGPQLGLQCWTFRSFSFFETLDKAHALGIRHLQAYPGQALGGGLEGAFGPEMSPDARATVQQWLRDRELAVVSMGVTGANSEAGWRQLFAFANALGIGTIATEAPEEQLRVAAPLAREAGLRLALHNHPTPSRYADPAVALAAIKDFGPHVGICADTGHWTRSGYDPVDALRSVAGRVLELHFKDVSEPARAAHDMPWGTGIGRAAAQIAELRRQNFNGYVFIEYEHNTAALEGEVARCIAFFRAALRATPEQLTTGRLVPPGFTAEAAALWRDRHASSPGRWPSPQPLLKPDLSNAEFAPGGWEWEGDVLVSRGNGDLWTKDSYGDFALSLEFRVEEGSNSGVFIRTSDTVEWLNNSIEVQILQGDAPNPRQVVGSIFDVQAPTRQLPIEPGQWNRYVIIAKGSKIEVHLNDEKVVDADLNQWATAGQNPDGTPNKFAKPYRDMAREGRIGLQYHGNPIAFRNLLIEKL